MKWLIIGWIVAGLLAIWGHKRYWDYTDKE